MDSRLINYFKKPQLAELPTTQLLAKSNFNEGKFLQEVCRSTPFIAIGETLLPYPVAFGDLGNDYVDLLTKPSINLLDATDIYYNGECTWFGNKPFEVFILNKTYREVAGLNINRLEFLDMFKFLPFHRELIIDTVNFILTGKRDINLKILRDISIQYYNDVRTKDKVMFPNLNVEQRFSWSEVENLTSGELFTKWVSQKDGVADVALAHRTILGL